MGTASQLKIMQLDFYQADFLMHCIELYCVDFGAGTPPQYTINLRDDKNEIVFDHKKIEDLYLKIQEFKFANR